MARFRKTTDKPASSKRPIAQYDHKGQQRKNNPHVGLVTPDSDRDAPRKQYAYDPHLDPTLTWARKAAHTSFEVPTVSLHVHERIGPKTIVEAVRRRNGTLVTPQGSLFESADENPIDDPAVIHRILAHLELPRARDGPEAASAVSPPRDDQPALPFALP